MRDFLCNELRVDYDQDRGYNMQVIIFIGMLWFTFKVHPQTL